MALLAVSSAVHEYLEHARRMGFDAADFYSFDGAAAAQHKRVLEHYVRTGWMRLHDWSPAFGTDTSGHPSGLRHGGLDATPQLAARADPHSE